MNNPLSSFSGRAVKLALDNMVVIIFVTLAIGLSILSPLFLTQDNVLNVLRQVAVITIISVGFTLVLGAGEIDLSIGGNMGLSGVFIAKMMVAGMPPILAVLLGMIIGVLLGFVNASLITVFKLNALITTLATLGIFRGIIYLVTDTKAVSGLPESFTWIGHGTLLSIPVPVILMLISVATLWFLINRTIFGRHAIAIGGGREAAVVSGISAAKIRFGVYGVMGAAAALAGALQTARSASAQVTAGDGIELDAIAAVVIGGTALWGGNARIVGTLFGCLIVGMVGNGLNLMAINANWQIVAKGVLILVAIILDSLSSGVIGRFSRRFVSRVKQGLSVPDTPAEASTTELEAATEESEKQEATNV